MNYSLDRHEFRTWVDSIGNFRYSVLYNDEVAEEGWQFELQHHLHNPGRPCFCDRLEMIVSRGHFLAADVWSLRHDINSVAQECDGTTSTLSLKNVTLNSSSS
jgi:hypothetical protein